MARPPPPERNDTEEAEGDGRAETLPRSPFASLLRRLLHVTPSEMKEREKDWRASREAGRL
jgi:hypothetical protein